MEDTVKFGKLDVNCEGWDFNTQTEIILVGSCALEYELDLTPKGRKLVGRMPESNLTVQKSPHRACHMDAIGMIGVFVILFVLGCILISARECVRKRRNTNYTNFTNENDSPSSSPTTNT